MLDTIQGPEGFHFIVTQDGSPSMRLGLTEPLSESMHSPKGAFSETLYIYGQAMELAIERKFPLRVLSMGLGIGYVEILAAALAEKHGVSCAGESFEIVPELRDWFSAWVASLETPAGFQKIYDEIEARTCQHLEIPLGSARAQLNSGLAKGDWQIRGAMTTETVFTAPFSVVCFDAFSSKSTPDLWSDEFLAQFLAKAAGPSCVLSTYACTGALKRSLKSAGFDVRIREGFASKRDSTFAVRTASKPDLGAVSK